MKASTIPYSLQFKTPGGTSRGVLSSKDTWFLRLEKNNREGWGEIGMFRGLSSDDLPQFEAKLAEVIELLEANVREEQLLSQLQDWPSIRFGVEQAFLSLRSSNPFTLFDSEFVRGKNSIAINGLVWMGEISFMRDQIHEKINSGFNCIKLKIGALDFGKELKLISELRSNFENIEIRVDANGAFNETEALEKLNRLAEFDLHSIEQPIKQGNISAMHKLCVNSSLPIALDEELIGINTLEEKQNLLEAIKPQFIILKPSLLGGFASCDEWIALAESNKIGWWVTSALESNIGLNAIAQFVAVRKTTMPQGLGTGGLFTNNIPSPLVVRNGALYYANELNWNLNLLQNG